MTLSLNIRFFQDEMMLK